MIERKLLHLTGWGANVLSRGILSSASAHADFPLAYLVDGVPGLPFQFNAAAADDYVRGDLDLLLGIGGAEAASDLDAFTGTGGTFDRVTSPTPPTGTYAFHIGHTAFARRDAAVLVRAGETINATAKLRGDGTAQAAVGFYNRHTGKWWSGSGWTATPSYVFGETGTAFSTKSGQFTIESFATCRRAVCTLEIRIALSQSGNAYFDDIALWPSWDFLSLHGHNLGPVTIDWLESTNAWSSSTSKGTPTIYSPTFWSRLPTPSTARYVGVEFTGTNHEPIKLGQWVVGRAAEAVQPPSLGYRWDWLEDAYESGTTFGQTFAHAATDLPRRRLELEFDHYSEASYQDQLEAFLRSRGRVYPGVIVPDDQKPSLAIHGRRPRVFGVNVQNPEAGVYTGGTAVIDEDPFWGSAQ